jgi:hypothetical protein
MRKLALALAITAVSTNAMAIWPFSSEPTYPIRAPSAARTAYVQNTFAACFGTASKTATDTTANLYFISTYCTCVANKLADNITEPFLKEEEELIQRGVTVETYKNGSLSPAYTALIQSTAKTCRTQQ